MKTILRTFVAVALIALITVILVRGLDATRRIAKFGSIDAYCVQLNAYGTPVYDCSWARNVYHCSWRMLDDNFLHRDRLADWSAWEHRFDNKITNEAEAVAAIIEMTGSLQEGYTAYLPPEHFPPAPAQDAPKPVFAVSRMLPNKIGYLQIYGFGDTVADDVQMALGQLSEAEAFVVDLRNNGGGSLPQAFQVFSMMVDEGTFATLHGYQNGEKYVDAHIVRADGLENVINGVSYRSARRANLTGKKPMVVLVNGGTASASEMLLGGLVDNKRAESYGTKTFGKGIAQITMALQNCGALRITYTKNHFPSDRCIDLLGFVPENEVQPVANGEDNQLAAALASIQKRL